MSDDNFLFHKTANELRAHPETLAVRVSREHYLWLADQIDGLYAVINELRARKTTSGAGPVQQRDRINENIGNPGIS